MSRLADRVSKVRSKNAGPFWLTFDIFCATSDDFREICAALDSARVAAALQVAPDTLRRFEIADLNVLKFSLPRPQIQGTRWDRDMHGASYANILAEMEI